MLKPLPPPPLPPKRQLTLDEISDNAAAERAFWREYADEREYWLAVAFAESMQDA